MTNLDWLGVSHQQALRFFFERLKDVSEDSDTPANELLYNASVLAHFATTSTASMEFPATPVSLTTVFDLFVLDRSLHREADIVEAAAGQCLLLTGFFRDQLKARHNIRWYATLGAGFFDRAAHDHPDRARARMLHTMALRFEFWRLQLYRLAVELRDEPRLILRGPGFGDLEI